jgi:hypothetical protein
MKTLAYRGFIAHYELHPLCIVVSVYSANAITGRLLGFSVNKESEVEAKFRKTVDERLAQMNKSYKQLKKAVDNYEVRLPA